MTENINKFVTIKEKKTGEYKYSCAPENIIHIYKYIYSLGFRTSKVNKFKILYKRNGNKIFFVNKTDFSEGFINFLKEQNYTGLSKEHSVIDIMNYFLIKNPIKENKLFNDIFYEELSNSEKHFVKMQKDIHYRHEFETNQMFEKLKDWGFKKRKKVDKGKTFVKSEYYYKSLGYNKYLVFDYSLTKQKNSDTFDCLIEYYDNEKDIGKKRAIETQVIKNSFLLEKDFGRIKELLDKKQ